MQDVTVKVPTERLAEFYEWFGRWLGGLDAHERHDPDTRAETLIEPWDARSDLALATKAWQQFPPRAKLVLGTLIDNPGKRFTGEQLARFHDIPNGMYGLAGTLAWPGRRLRKLGRRHPFKVEPNPNSGSYYSMDPETASLFDEVRINPVSGR